MIRSHRGLVMTVALVAIGILASGCSISFSTDAEVADGGVYRSADRGVTWEAINTIPSSTGTPTLINDVNIRTVVIDPQDHQTVYALTADRGVLYSYTSGNQWLTPPRQPQEMRATVALVVDPQAECTIYTAALTRIFKTTNCGRDWVEVYRGSRGSDAVRSLAIDWFAPTILYAGTSEGNFLKSSDAGTSWQQIGRVPNASLEKIVVDPNDSRRVYWASAGKGMFRTYDSGATWEDPITKILRDFPGSTAFHNLVPVPSEGSTFIHASDYGLLKTTDGGDSWQPIELVTNPKEVPIRAVAVDPENSNGIYYATDNTFYTSLDGGQNWVTEPLPTSRSANSLTVDSENPNVLYMGTAKFEE